jgi:alkylation response protein AidB-like acyl-CoA dehydrogenase
MRELADEERQLLEAVTRFVDEEVRPAAHDLERANTYPAELIDAMKEMGLFGLAVPEPYGPGAVSSRCYAQVTAEMARGWMSLAGAMGGHSVICKVLSQFGTDEQKQRYLPGMATGEIRATMALTEPGGGSDLQAMRTVAIDKGDRYVVNGVKTWITNAERAELVALLCKTDPSSDPPHRGMSVLLVERAHGYTVSKEISKLGYRGVESCEIVFDDVEVPASAVLGGAPGQGFSQMMRGLEWGRIQVAGRALGVAQAAFDDALAYAVERETFGRPIWQHQSIGNYLADMATSLHAARLLVDDAADRLDAGLRSDLESSMAKLFASEACMDITQKAMRIHGGYGYSTEFDIERYYRDAPLMVIGEGTNEVLRGVIARRLVSGSGRRGGPRP